MAQPTMVKVDPEELERLTARAASLSSDIKARYSAIDKSLEDLREHWAGKNRTLFYSQVEKVREERDRAVRALDAFCNELLPIDPEVYDQLEDVIQQEVEKLRNGQS